MKHKATFYVGAGARRRKLKITTETKRLTPTLRIGTVTINGQTYGIREISVPKKL